MSAINKKKIYLYGFNSDQLKIIKARNSNALFIAENKITKIINSCSAIIAPTRKSIETALEEVDFKRNNKNILKIIKDYNSYRFNLKNINRNKNCKLINY